MRTFIRHDDIANTTSRKVCSISTKWTKWTLIENVSQIFLIAETEKDNLRDQNHDTKSSR